MKSIASALVTLALVGLAGPAFAQEDRFDRALREGRQIQAQQEAASRAQAEWLRSPAGQDWIKSQQRGPQEPIAPVPTGASIQGSADPWTRAIHLCTRYVNDLDPGGDFSAFAPLPGKVRMIGTVRQQYEFEFCMANLRMPLK
jgi:hypothetical protein